MFYFSNKKGFTLIELLVVISIIGLLSSIVLASLNTAKIKSENARRLKNLSVLQDAVELYYADYGEYPSSSSNWSGPRPDRNNTTYNLLISGGYISSQPEYGGTYDDIIYLKDPGSLRKCGPNGKVNRPYMAMMRYEGADQSVPGPYYYYGTSQYTYWVCRTVE